MSNPLFYRFARSFPIPIQEWAKTFVRQAGEEYDPYVWLAQTSIIALLAGIVGGIILFVGSDFATQWLHTLSPALGLSPLLGGVIGFVFGLLMGLGLRYVQLYYVIDSRTSLVENILPDFLLLVAGNIRAGMTSFSAFRGGARPEFGALSEEIKAVSSRSLGVESFTGALSTISGKIKSKSLTETVGYFLQAMKSGGKLAQLLESTSADLRRSQDLKKELRSATQTYVIFVAFVIVIATPLLMAVSVEFVQLIGKIQSQSFAQSSTELSGVGFVGGKINITPEFLTSVAYILFLGNAILAGLFIGVISNNKPLLGLRYSIPMFIVTLIIFAISRHFLSGLLGLS